MPRSTSDALGQPGAQEERPSPLGKRVKKGQPFAPARDGGHGAADAGGGGEVGETSPRTSKLRGSHGSHRDDREGRARDETGAGPQKRGGAGGGGADGGEHERDWDPRAAQSEDGDGDDGEAGGPGGGVDMSAIDSDFKIFPRRKGGQSKKCAESAPVIITAELLQTCFDMPLVHAAKKLGICATALKKVCRKLGIHKWPYKEMKPSLSLCRQGDADAAGLPGGARSPPASTPCRDYHDKDSSSRDAGRKGGSREGFGGSDLSPPSTGRRHAARGAGVAGGAAGPRGGKTGSGDPHAASLHVASFPQSVGGSKWPAGLQSPRSATRIAGIGAPVHRTTSYASPCEPHVCAYARTRSRKRKPHTCTHAWRKHTRTRSL